MRRSIYSGMNPFTAGLIAIVVLTAAVYMAFAGRFPWERDFQVEAVVRSASELHSRTPVRMAGVDVGKVTGFRRGPGGTGIITLSLKESALPLHTDATLKVRPRIFLEGNFFVDLKPGSPSAPELGNHGTIPLSQTATPVQLDQILSTLDSPSRAELLHVVDALANGTKGGGAQGFNDSLKWWSPAFLGSAQAAEGLRGERPHDLSEFIRDGGITAAAIARDRAALADLVTGLNRSLRALATRRADVERSVSELAGVVTEARPAFRAINEAIPPARQMLRDVRPSLRDAPPALRDANALLAEAQRLLDSDELPALLDQLEPAIGTLAVLEPRLRELLGQVTPATECTRLHVLPTLLRSVEDPPHTTGMPVYQELLSSLVGLASASQNFTGHGPSLRYHAGFGDNMVSLGDATSSAGEALVGLTSEEIQGSRPKYTGVRPPFRPDVSCLSQDLPNLKAETGPAPQQRRLGG